MADLRDRIGADARDLGKCQMEVARELSAIRCRRAEASCRTRVESMGRRRLML